jgi:ParB family chromosome partitioning protein
MDEAKQTVKERTEANRLASLGKRPGNGAVTLPFANKMRPPKKEEGRQVRQNVYAVRLDRLTPDANQPRKEFDPQEVQALADSIKAKGQLQPILVRWEETLEQYKIISGEQRYRACKHAGLETVDCIIVEDDLSESDVRVLQLIENLHRTDLKPMEKARAYQELIAVNRWSKVQLAEALGLPNSAVSQTLALLELPEDVQAKVESEQIPARTAYEIQKLDDEDKQRELAERVTAEKLTRDQTASAVRQLKGKKAPARRRPKASPAPRLPETREYRFATGGKVSVTFSPDVTPEQIDSIASAIAHAGAKQV